MRSSIESLLLMLRDLLGLAITPSGETLLFSSSWSAISMIARLDSISHDGKSSWMLKTFTTHFFLTLKDIFLFNCLKLYLLVFRFLRRLTSSNKRRIFYIGKRINTDSYFEFFLFSESPFPHPTMPQLKWRLSVIELLTGCAIKVYLGQDIFCQNHLLK